MLAASNSLLLFMQTICCNRTEKRGRREKWSLGDFEILFTFSEGSRFSFFASTSPGLRYYDMKIYGCLLCFTREIERLILN